MNELNFDQTEVKATKGINFENYRRNGGSIDLPKLYMNTYNITIPESLGRLFLIDVENNYLIKSRQVAAGLISMAYTFENIGRASYFNGESFEKAKGDKS